MDPARRAFRLRCAWLAIVGSLLASPSPLAAQEPAGPTFRVNEATTASASFPAVAVAPTGEFVIVWRVATTVTARLLDATGQPRGVEFMVGQIGAQGLPSPRVSTTDAGTIVVVWPSTSTVLARRYSVDGAPLGPEFTVGQGGGPAVAGDAGGFVVVWDKGYGTLVGRRFAATGNPLGNEFDTGLAPIGSNIPPDVAIDGGGEFVVVSDLPTSGYPDVAARCYDAAGNPKGPVFRVNSYTTGSQSGARVAAGSQGRFLVAWVSNPLDGSGARSMTRMIEPSCVLQAMETVVSGSRPGGGIDVAGDAAGGFLAAWLYTPPQSTASEVVARRISRSGAVRGAEFSLQPPGFRTGLLASGGPEGGFTATWMDFEQPASNVYARRLTALGARPMDVDGTAGPASDGNHVLEPGETVRVAPAWFNSVEGPLSADGSASGFTGPPGPGVSYAAADVTAAYGTLPPGSTVACWGTGDCYSLGVAQAAGRPVHHWDASFVEVLEPAVLGQSKRWTLHIGDSFGDVPRGSHFYPLIETLFHGGVTGGCGGNSYCPAGATTRDQMSVFVLTAREGAGYRPPSCTTPVFSDVPAASPFCRWVEELARRGVVSGCGGGNFCPSSSVLREQMAVFVLRTLDPALSPPACTTPLFGDVPASSSFCRWIEELVRRGVVTGCGGGNYCPAQPVTREQMSVFLSISFGLTLYGP